MKKKIIFKVCAKECTPFIVFTSMIRFLLTSCFCLAVFVTNAQNENRNSTEPSDRVYFDALPFMDVWVAADQELIVMQWKNLNSSNIPIILEDKDKLRIDSTVMSAGTTIAFFDTKKRYAGHYEVCVQEGKKQICQTLWLDK